MNVKNNKNETLQKFIASFHLNNTRRRLHKYEKFRSFKQPLSAFLLARISGNKTLTVWTDFIYRWHKAIIVDRCQGTVIDDSCLGTVIVDSSLTSVNDDSYHQKPALKVILYQNRLFQFSKVRATETSIAEVETK